MTFPKALLADHESIVFDLRPHWISMVPPTLWTLLLIGGSLAAYAFDIYNGDGRYEWFEILTSVILTGAWLVLAVVPFLRWRFTNFVLTSDRLITREGIIAKHSKEIPLERINDVAFSQSILERFLGAGDLMIESAGERGQTRIGNIRKPEQVQLMIYKETETNNNRMMRPPAMQRQTTIPEQIEALARLNKQGVLSDLEFEEKKKQLLDRL